MAAQSQLDDAQHANPGPATLFFMGKRVPSEEAVEMRARLEALIAFFERERKTLRGRLAEEFLGYDKSTITNAINRYQVSAALRLRFEEKLGVPQRYWSAPKRIAPEECVPPPGQHVTPGERARAHSVQRLTQIAKRRGDPPSVAGRLAYLDAAGHEDDAWWWIDRYFEILEEEKLARVAPKRG